MRNPFRRNTVDVPVTVEPEPPAIVVDSVEMALPIRKLSALFIEQGWMVALDGKHPKEATPGRISAILAGHIEEMMADPDTFYTAGYRFLSMRDKDFPDDLDLYLYVGRATTSPEVTN
ncbi:hypothetical protein AB0B57_22490 [Micromonospora sp. NPDC049101]|uniref:hypothetical protein n=1 Tax=Micromonospora sp. NPDC049101 TaxID=3155032 RepID=UPI0033CAC8D0